MTTLKFWGFWDWTGNISWNRVIDHRVLHQLTTFLLKAIKFNEKWNDLVCIRILQHSVDLYNCTFMLSPAKWIKGRRRCWDRWVKHEQDEHQSVAWDAENCEPGIRGDIKGWSRPSICFLSGETAAASPPWKSPRLISFRLFFHFGPGAR